MKRYALNKIDAEVDFLQWDQNWTEGKTIRCNYNLLSPLTVLQLSISNFTINTSNK